MRRRAGTKERRGRLERVMFSFMGPPQLGDVNAPVTHRSDPADDLCDRCGQAWDAHETVRTSSHTYLVCPGAGQADG